MRIEYNHHIVDMSTKWWDSDYGNEKFSNDLAKKILDGAKI